MQSCMNSCRLEQAGTTLPEWGEDVLNILGLGRAPQSKNSDAVEEELGSDEDAEAHGLSLDDDDVDHLESLTLPSPLLEVPPTPLFGPADAPMTPLLEVPPTPTAEVDCPDFRAKPRPPAVASASAPQWLPPPVLPHIPTGWNAQHRPQPSPLWGGASFAKEKSIPVGEDEQLWGEPKRSKSRIINAPSTDCSVMKLPRWISRSPVMSPMSQPQSPAGWLSPKLSPKPSPKHAGRPRASSRQDAECDSRHSSWVSWEKDKFRSYAEASNCMLRHLCQMPDFSEAVLVGLQLDGSGGLAPSQESLKVDPPYLKSPMATLETSVSQAQMQHADSGDHKPEAELETAEATAESKDKIRQKNIAKSKAKAKARLQVAAASWKAAAEAYNHASSDRARARASSALQAAEVELKAAEAAVAAATETSAHPSATGLAASVAAAEHCASAIDVGHDHKSPKTISAEPALQPDDIAPGTGGGVLWSPSGPPPEFAALGARSQGAADVVNNQQAMEAFALSSKWTAALRRRYCLGVLQPPLTQPSDLIEQPAALEATVQTCQPSAPAAKADDAPNRDTSSSIPAAEGIAIASLEGPAPIQHSDIALRMWASLISPEVRIAARGGLPGSLKITAAAPNRTCWRGGLPPSQEELTLSLAAQRFALYEYIEEHPALLPSVGMGHRVPTFYVPAALSQSGVVYTGPALGPLYVRRPTRLLASEPLPGLLGKKVQLRAGQGLAVLESSLSRAPLVRHEAQHTDFLLIQPHHGDRTQLRLRRLNCVCVVGQTEPSLEVSPPASRQCARTRRKCIGQMARQVWRNYREETGSDDRTDAMQPLVVNTVARWWQTRDATAIRAEVRDCCEIAEWQQMTPEDVCMLEAVKRGEDRLQALGIDELRNFDKPLSKAVKELEELEGRQSAGDDSLVLSARWVMEQLQLTPWYVTSQYATVVRAQKQNFAIVGPGDISGGHGESVSFLPASLKHVQECMEMSALQQMSSNTLATKLREAGVSEATFQPLCRWDRLALLCNTTGSRESQNWAITGWSRAGPKVSSRQKAPPIAELRRQHDNLLQETFQRQLQALSFGRKAPTLDVERDSFTPDTAGSVAPASVLNSDNLEEALLDALDFQETPHELPPAAAKNEEEPEDDDGAEMKRLRAALTGKEAQAEPAVPQVNMQPAEQSSQRKVQMLKVVTVEKSPTGKLVDRVLYVFGKENIELYRGLQQEQAARKAAWSASACKDSTAKRKGAAAISAEAPTGSASGTGRTDESSAASKCGEEGPAKRRRSCAGTQRSSAAGGSRASNSSLASGGPQKEKSSARAQPKRSSARLTRSTSGIDSSRPQLLRSSSVVSSADSGTGKSSSSKRLRIV
eukprot:TRINITY_DN60565_c0_g1_i1.p1 TRINITY_DN60565_c0_g1~~TRINITY_DN60565_c0_g1_i1.p1  ORF type:complete len:1356 (+),score=257.25 TRINITY_DN60565_c0_g1_i1:205-4272(+)